MPNEHLSPSDHPSDEIMTAYCHGSEDHIPEIEAHLSGCADCRAAVLRIIREYVQDGADISAIRPTQP